MDDSSPPAGSDRSGDAAREQELLLAQLETLSEAQLDAQGLTAWSRFARQYFETASLDALRLRSPAALVQSALGHLQWASERNPGEIRVRVLPPAEGASLAVAETCTDDMPFLVDTVAIAIRDAGVAIDWAAHPVLHPRRDAQGRLREPAAADGTAESWIHIEFEPLLGEGAYAALEQALRDALADLQRAVSDFEAMKSRAVAVADSLRQVPAGADASEFAEARDFLLWLTQDHFSFFGYSETAASPGDDGRTRLDALPDAALGLSRPGQRYADADSLIAPLEQLEKYADSPRVVVITKANRRSSIHLAEYMDVVSVKQYREDGSVAGTARFVGLFGADVYIDRPSTIPVVRRKAEYVMRRSRLAPDSHSGKHLREVLYSLPRDELFQSGEEELFDTCMGIRALRERHQLKLFMRRDRYGRFYSCMLYLPRDRYSRELRDRVAQELQRMFNALSVDRTVDFLRGSLARIRYVVRTPPGTQLPLAAQEVEQKLIALTRSWREQLREVLTRSADANAALRFADAFPLSYTEAVSPIDAGADVQFLLRLSPSHPLLPRLILDHSGSEPRVTHLKLYAQGKPVALSDVLPTLEHFGLRVIEQDPTEVAPKDGGGLWIQAFAVEAPVSELAPELQKSYFEHAFIQAWNGGIENDSLNRLVLAAGLDARQVTLLRALVHYVNQIGLPYGRADIEQLLAQHAKIARLLVRLFEARFDPRNGADKRQLDEVRYAQEIEAELDAITSLDADRVLRAVLSVVRAMLRTNAYQADDAGAQKNYLSFKLDPAQIPELPLPRPLFEIWVYSVEVAGVHLRGGRVARGGLRWSDRREDFRTEVLGLMKAQMVKNAVIVPVGAKGGFVVKKPVDASNREAFMAQGVACYKTFLHGLLDITDNRVGDEIQPPRDVVRYDEDDPYLVVAADKGTASFSDIANGVAAEYGFWLGDAFASGGSAGYDHKKMGITARGAWESVKRHFREIDVDIQQQDFTVVGVGDMSGDVFGNGMLLSPHIKLLAAFDHRHIFIDPNPDPAKALAERQRLFVLPRSSWADYDAQLISQGGGIYPRNTKHIPLSDEARAVLGIDAKALTPAELMRAILKAPVDLLWNGGIGTYVKAEHQSHADVRDRANDAIRVDGRDLRAKVVGEGGNLGFTQSGRIEYALHGGRINTDAIDNSGGVHCSDREVNIKIPLNRLMAEGRLTREERDPLLVQMTDEVAHFVLRDSYVQSAAISLIEREAPQRLDEHVALMRILERDGLLNRAIEYLPDEDALKERRSEGRGLTRPEIAVLMAYAKISLFDAALDSDLPDDPFFLRGLLSNFPKLLVERFREDLLKHRLKREIIATLVVNAVVNRMGLGFVHLMSEDHGSPRDEVLKAYAAAHEIFHAERYWKAIEETDGQLAASRQYALMNRAAGLLRHATGYLVMTRDSDQEINVGDLVQRYADAIAQLEPLVPQRLSPLYREAWDRYVSGQKAEGVPEPLAQLLGNTLVMGAALDVVDLAGEAGLSLEDAGAAYFQLGERLRMPWLLAAIVALPVRSKWQTLARNNLRDDAYRIHRLLAASVLKHEGEDAEARVNAWIAANERSNRFALARVQELQASGEADFAGLAVAVRELAKLSGL